MVLDMLHREHTNPNKKNSRKPMKWILVDSAIIGFIAFFAAMPNVIPTIGELLVMAKAFAGSFLFQLAVERGIKRGKRE